MRARTRTSARRRAPSRSAQTPRSLRSRGCRRPTTPTLSTTAPSRRTRVSHWRGPRSRLSAGRRACPPRSGARSRRPSRSGSRPRATPSSPIRWSCVLPRRRRRTRSTSARHPSSRGPCATRVRLPNPGSPRRCGSKVTGASASSPSRPSSTAIFPAARRASAAMPSGASSWPCSQPRRSSTRPSARVSRSPTAQPFSPPETAATEASSVPPRPAGASGA